MNEPISAKCGGHCCRWFTLPLSPEEMADPEVMATKQDGAFIADMVIPLGPANEAPDMPEGAHLPENEGYWAYRCRHLDDESGLCTVYDRRPRMCALYPYGNACQYTACEAPRRCVPEPLVSHPVPASYWQPLRADRASGGMEETKEVS